MTTTLARKRLLFGGRARIERLGGNCNRAEFHSEGDGVQTRSRALPEERSEFEHAV